MLAKWNGKLITVNFLLNLTPLGLPYINKGRLWIMAKSTRKSEFHPYAVFSTRAQRGSGQARISRSLVLTRFNLHPIKSQDGSSLWLAVELDNNSPEVFRNWHEQTFEKCCTRFYLDWRRSEGLKGENWSYQILYVLNISFTCYVLQKSVLNYHSLFIFIKITFTV